MRRWVPCYLGELDRISYPLLTDVAGASLRLSQYAQMRRDRGLSFSQRKLAGGGKHPQAVWAPVNYGLQRMLKVRFLTIGPRCEDDGPHYVHPSDPCPTNDETTLRFVARL